MNRLISSVKTTCFFRGNVDFPNFDTPIDSKPNKKKSASDMGLGVKAELIDDPSDMNPVLRQN